MSQRSLPCPNCQKEVMYLPGYAGMTVSCPRCAREIRDVARTVRAEGSADSAVEQSFPCVGGTALR
jgi:hypothetical protein